MQFEIESGASKPVLSSAILRGYFYKMKSSLFCLFILLISGCLSEAKLARLCHERFPVQLSDYKDSTHVDSSRFTSVTTPFPPVSYPVNCPASDLATIIHVTIPGGQKTTDTIFIYQSKYRTVYDSTGIFMLKEQLLRSISEGAADSVTILSLKTELTHKSKRARQLWIGIIILLLIIAILVGLRFSKNLSFLATVLRG